jgi:hypothetical protein
MAGMREIYELVGGPCDGAKLDLWDGKSPGRHMQWSYPIGDGPARGVAHYRRRHEVPVDQEYLATVEGMVRVVRYDFERCESNATQN